MHLKNFLGWMGLKQKLDLSSSQIPLVNEGEVWWVSLGENVGYEINGKSHLFTRPVLIYRKFAHGFYFIIPLTSQNKKGSWYVSFFLHKKQQVACLNQARAIDYRRLYSRLGRIQDSDLEAVHNGFKNLYQ